MKYKVVIMFFSLFFASCYRIEMNRCKKSYIKSLCRLTDDGHSVYATINIRGKGKLLINTYELYPVDHIATNDYTDTLCNILFKKYWRPTKPLGYLEKRFIDMNIYRKIYKTKPIEVYNQYFDKDGFPKDDKFSEQEIEAAIAYLIDCNTLILGGQMFLYRVNSPPIHECNRYDKKRE